MQALRQWFRVVFPHAGFARFVFVVYVIVCAVCYSTLAYISDDMAIRGNPLVAREGLVIAAAMAYGVYRMRAYFPLYDDGYMRLIKQTAWTPDKPLPLGPVHLVWQDAAIVGVMMLMIAYQPLINPVRILSLSLLAYLWCLASIFVRFALWRYAYGLIFAIGLAVFFWPDPLLSAALMLAAYAFGFRGLEAALAGFHDRDAEQLSGGPVPRSRSPRGRALDQRFGRFIGWPFDALAPRVPALRYMNQDVYGISPRHGLIVSVLAGWSVFAIGTCVFDGVQRYGIRPSPVDAEARSIVPRTVQVVVHELRTPTIEVKREVGAFTGIVLFATSLMLAGSRLETYMKGLRAPFGGGGRKELRQWIIPTFDRVFVSPMCIVLAATLLYPVAIYVLGISPFFAAPISAALMVLCAVNMGPNRVEWILTSPCQLVPTIEYRGRQFEEFDNS